MPRKKFPTKKRVPAAKPAPRPRVGKTAGAKKDVESYKRAKRG